MEKTLVVQNGNHLADHCPVSLRLEDFDYQSAQLQLRDLTTGRVVAHQLEPCVCGTSAKSLNCVADSLSPGEKREFELTDDPKHPWTDRVTIGEVDGDHADVTLDGALFTAYQYGPAHVRPYCHPVIGPYGDPITRGYPMVKGVEGELEDHHHHKAFYVAHGDVGGSENWSEEKGHGFVRTRELKCTGGAVLGQIVALNDWVDADGRKACEERRVYRIWATPSSGRIVDLRITFIASEGDLKFGDTKEGGLCSLRLHYHSKLGSLITSPTGALTAEGTPDETWGKRFHWLDHSGPVKGKWCGATIMDTPGNFRYPSYWHVRTNGMMTANPFGLSYYYDDPSVDGSHTVPAGESLTFRYRVYFHAGCAAQGKVAEKYNNYVYGPTLVQLKE